MRRQAIKSTIERIRAGGGKANLLVSLDNWDKPKKLPEVLTACGGLQNFDVLKRTGVSIHHYWNKNSNPGQTGNDQANTVDGTIDMATTYGPALAAARQRGPPVCMSEIGGGHHYTLGWMQPYLGKGKNGEVLQQEFIQFGKANWDILCVAFWNGGKTDATYKHKILLDSPHGEMLARFWRNA